MTRATDLAIKCGIAYFLTPENTTEMHGSDRQIEAFAEAIRAEEREAAIADCVEAVKKLGEPWKDYPREAYTLAILRLSSNA